MLTTAFIHPVDTLNRLVDKPSGRLPTASAAALWLDERAVVCIILPIDTLSVGYLKTLATEASRLAQEVEDRLGTLDV